MSAPIKVATADCGDTASAAAVIVFALLGLTGLVGTPGSWAPEEGGEGVRVTVLVTEGGFAVEGLRECLNVLIR